MKKESTLPKWMKSIVWKSSETATNLSGNEFCTTMIRLFNELRIMIIQTSETEKESLKECMRKLLSEITELKSKASKL